MPKKSDTNTDQEGMMRRDEHGGYRPDELELDTHTVFVDRASNRLVLRVHGVVVLPIGAEVELTQPNVNAKVVGVRLLAGLPAQADKKGLPARVCLDVEVPEEYWSAQERC